MKDSECVVMGDSRLRPPQLVNADENGRRFKLVVEINVHCGCGYRASRLYHGRDFLR